MWLTLEHLNIPYDTVRIDNTGPGVKPSYFAGQTPQIRWEDGRVQGESMDIVQALDVSNILYAPSDVHDKIAVFHDVFPRNARPSSRAAFLFSWNGDPLSRTKFARVLQVTDDLLASSSATDDDGGGPFLCGQSFSAADVAWAPFLERYAAQLPCLHDDLQPKDEREYPHLYQWYKAMEEQIPAYACRVKGDASSWRKVLGMAGFGNIGNVPTDILQRMKMEEDSNTCLSEQQYQTQQRLWGQYRSTRGYLAETPSAEAAATIVRNREAILKDAERRAKFTDWKNKLPLSTPNIMDDALRALASLLIQEGEQAGPDAIHAAQNNLDPDTLHTVGVLASFLDDRMCVPRDMGPMSAAAIKRIAVSLKSD